MLKSIILVFVIFMIVTEQSEYETSLCKLKELNIIYDNYYSCYKGYFIGNLIDKKNVILESNIIIYKSNFYDECSNSKSHLENWECDYDFNETYICYYSLENNDAYLSYTSNITKYCICTLIISMTLCIIIYRKTIIDCIENIENINRQNNNNRKKIN